MTPNWYITMKVTPVSGPSGPGSGDLIVLTSNDVLANLLRSVHGICASRQIPFASAFPGAHFGANPHPGNHLRIFVESKEHADTLLNILQQNKAVVAHVTISEPQEVVRTDVTGIATSPDPRSFAGSFVSYQLFRNTSRKNRNKITRLRQIEAGAKLPYIHMRSKSGHAYSLRFNVVRVNDAGANDAVQLKGGTNGYGLSTRKAPLFLPDVPL